MLDDPVPLRPTGGCGAAARGFGGAWRSRTGAPDYAGEFTFRHTRARYLIFVCAAQRHVLPESHPVTDAERAVLDRRRKASRRSLAGGPWEPPQPINVRHGRARRAAGL